MNSVRRKKVNKNNKKVWKRVKMEVACHNISETKSFEFEIAPLATRIHNLNLAFSDLSFTCSNKARISKNKFMK